MKHEDSNKEKSGGISEKDSEGGNDNTSTNNIDLNRSELKESTASTTSPSTTSVFSTGSRTSRHSEDSVCFSLPQHDAWPVLLKNKLAKVIAKTSPGKNLLVKTKSSGKSKSRGKSTSTFKSSKSKR